PFNSGMTAAFRGGYYRQARNRFFLLQAANPDIDKFLRPIFGSNAGDYVSHWTMGGGIVFKNFQADVALDLSQKNDVDLVIKHEVADGGYAMIVSTVVRF